MRKIFLYIIFSLSSLLVFLAIAICLLGSQTGVNAQENLFNKWREGKIVASAQFDPGIAPFTIDVRKVPVLVTKSEHFVVTLYRGQYPVTSFRYFWLNYTPKKVTISWRCIDRFTVRFDDLYEANCEWSWGKGAQWSMTVPPNSKQPGLSPYFFTPRNPIPEGCKEPDFDVCKKPE